MDFADLKIARRSARYRLTLSRRIGPTALFALGLVGLLLCSRQALAVDRCAGCHIRLPDDRVRTPALQLRDSPHRDDLIGCSACHGGDRTDPTIHAHTASNFNRRPAREDIPKLCGSCHGDPRFIRRFDPSLPVDQLVAYETSVHGERFKAGDPKAPVCTSCHGIHDIMGRADPRSRIHPSRVADTCKSCHADANLMAGYGLPTNQYELWKSSVHGRGVAKGNLEAATCVDCHTAHAATPPTVTSVSRICGRCHTDQLERFRASPHARAFERLGFPECEQCHGNHGVASTNETMLGLGPEAVCGKCHDPGQKAALSVQSMVATIRQAHDKANAARAAVDAASRSGLAVTDAAAGLEQVHTAELRLANVLHDFDPKKLQDAGEEVSVAADRVTQSLATASTGRSSYARFVGIVAVLVFVHLILLLLRIRNLAAASPEKRP